MEAQDLVCNPENKGFADLKIKPVSFGQKAHEYINDIIWMYNTHDITKRESANNWSLHFHLQSEYYLNISCIVF